MRRPAPTTATFWRSRWGLVWLGGLALFWPFGDGMSLTYRAFITVLTAAVWVVWLWTLTAAYGRVTGWLAG
jgi:hypothetical protein